MLKNIVCLVAFGVASGGMFAQGTTIAQFRLSMADLPQDSKTFINNTKHKLKIHWKIINRTNQAFEAQEPLVLSSNIVLLDMGQAGQVVGRSVAASGYDVIIEVSKILKTPKKKGDVMKVRGFKNGKKDLVLSSATFLQNSEFELLVGQGGLLECNPVLRASKLPQ